MAESNVFYKPTYESGLFDFSRDLYQQDALNTRKDALGARRAATQQKKFGKPSALKEPWSPYAGIYQEAIRQNLQTAIKASSEGDLETHRQAMANIDEANMFAQMSKQQGSQYDPVYKDMLNNIGDYEGQSRQAFMDLKDKGGFVEGYEVKDGKITYDGEAWTNTNRFGLPNFVKAEDYIFDSIRKDPSINQLANRNMRTNADGSTTFLKDNFREEVGALFSDIGTEYGGKLSTPEAIQDMTDRTVNWFSKAEKSAPLRESDEPKKDPWETWSTKMGAVPIPPEQSNEIPNAKGVAVKMSPSNIKGIKGGKAVPTAFYVTDDGKLMFSAVKQNESIIDAANKGDEAVMATLINEAEELPAQEYDADKHGNILSYIGKYMPNPTSDKMMMFINYSNGLGKTVSGYTEEELQPLVNSTFDMNTLKRLPKNKIDEAFAGLEVQSSNNQGGVTVQEKETISW